MSTRLRATAVALITAASACRTGTPSPEMAPVPSRAESDARVALATAAGRQLRQGIDARDHALVARTLAEGVELVTFEGDTIRGRAPATQFLVDAGGAGGEAFRIFAGTLMPCREGGMEEIGATYNAPAAPGAASGAFRQGAAAIAWNVDAAAASAARIDLSVPRSSSYRARCAPLYVTEARAQRLVATFGIDATPPGQSPAVRSIAEGMPARGLAYTPVVMDWQPEPFPRVSTAIAGATAGLRYRLRPAWTAGLQAGFRAPSSVEGVNPVERRHVVVKTLPIPISTFVQYQRGPFRIGAGPAVLLQNFKVTETHERIYFVGATSGWERVSDSTTTSSALSPAVGVSSEVAVMLSASRRSLVELNLGFAAFGKSRVPETPYFREMQVSNSLLTAGISVGVGR